jgi:hypothetical protein
MAKSDGITLLFLYFYLFTVLFSIAIISRTYHQYKKKKGTGFKMVKMAFLEPFVIQLYIVFCNGKY